MTSHGSFTLLWQKILRSSLWITGTKEQRILWIAMLAMKDAEGRVLSSLVGLADAAKLNQYECKEALEMLMAPDPNDTSGVEQGIRVKQIAGGWAIVNHELYRFSTEARREFWRQQKAEQRATKGTTTKPKGKPDATFTQLNGEPGAFVQCKPDPETQKMLRKDIRDYVDKGQDDASITS